MLSTRISLLSKPGVNLVSDDSTAARVQRVSFGCRSAKTIRRFRHAVKHRRAACSGKNLRLILLLSIAFQASMFIILLRILLRLHIG